MNRGNINPQLQWLVEVLVAAAWRMVEGRGRSTIQEGCAISRREGIA